MNPSPNLRLAAAALFAFTLTLAGRVLAQPQPPVNEAGGVQWVCGGVSEEGRRELEARQVPANLSLTFATAETRAYVADVRVTLFEAGSKKERMSFVADAPICLVKAPAGRYRIEASFGGITRTANAVVGAGTTRPQPLVFTYPEVPAEKPPPK
jgi:hypothetical protein